MLPPHVLVVDDDPGQLSLLSAQLSTAGYQISTALTAAEALRLLADTPPQLIILDLRLPDMPGEELCKLIRTQSRVPIVVVSLYGDEARKTKLLDAGADDFVVKPIPYTEFLARLRAVLRRAMPANQIRPERLPERSTTFCLEELHIDVGKRQVLRAGENIHLSPTEWRVLTALLEAPPPIASHEQLILDVWGTADGSRRTSLHVTINQLRQKLERDPAQPTLITTVPNVGYRIHAAPVLVGTSW